MKIRKTNLATLAAAGTLALLSTTVMAQTTLTIGLVNNADMVRMQSLADDFTAANPDIELNWLSLEENELRQRITTDIATKSGQFDVMMIGTLETPIWAAQEWLLPLTELQNDPEWDADDLIPAIRNGLSYEGTLYSAPFSGESTFTMYRTDLMEKAGLTMPEFPTWSFIREAADAMTDRENGINGICLRGQAGWGVNMGLLTGMAASMGGRWFDMDWRPQFDTEPWREMLTYYVDIMKENGPAGAASNGFNENLTLFQQGKCAIWVDSTAAAAMVNNPAESTVAGNVGYALAPHKDGVDIPANWIWSWALAVPAGSQKVEAAQKFIGWATSKEYAELVASKDGLANVTPGTRTSLYENPEYMDTAPFASLVIKAIESADPTKPSVEPVPYIGRGAVYIPEYMGYATTVSQEFQAALAGTQTVDQALENAQKITTREMSKAGYIK